jgi:predicted dehydrogenase
MTSPVRLGVIGLGSVSHKYLRQAEQLKFRGQVELVAACDRNPDRQNDVARQFGFRTFSTDYEDVLNHPDVDLILILTPMQTHGPMTLEALETGRHVLVEKPMAIDLDQAKAVLETSRTSRGMLMCAPHVVLSQTYQNIWKRIHSGAIGTPYLARALYGWSGPWWGQWFYQTGGGPTFDLGVYNVTSLTGLLGPVQRVTAMAGTAIPERVVEGEAIKVLSEDNLQLLMDFGNNLFAVVTTGFTIQQYRCAAIEVYGSRGTIQMMGDDWDPEGYELWENRVGAWQIYGEPDPAWPWTDGIRHMVECVQNGTKPLNTPEHAYHVTEIMIKGLEAARDGQARVIDSTFPPLRFAGEEVLEVSAAHLVHDPT